MQKHAAVAITQIPISVIITIPIFSVIYLYLIFIPKLLNFHILILPLLKSKCCIRKNNYNKKRAIPVALRLRIFPIK